MLFAVGYQKIPILLRPIHVVRFVVLSSTFFLVTVPHTFNFLFGVFFLVRQINLIGPLLKNMKLWRLPKLEGSILKNKHLPIWPSYIGERMTRFAKAYGI